MRVWVLGSGSRGNAVLLECGDTRLLVDAGFAPRELAARLAVIGVAPQSIEACVITHEHADHVKGAGVAARRWGWQLFATPGTAAGCPALVAADARTVEAGAGFAVGQFDVATVPVSHDAADPVAVVVTARATGARAAVCYDLGFAGDAVRQGLKDLDVLVLESNHDDAMLRSGPYPPVVQQRIASRHGHLSNSAAARVARECVTPNLRHLVLAHLSQQCNDGRLARQAMSAALARTRFRGVVDAAAQDAVCGPFLPRGVRQAPVAEQLGFGF